MQFQFHRIKSPNASSEVNRNRLDAAQRISIEFNQISILNRTARGRLLGSKFFKKQFYLLRTDTRLPIILSAVLQYFRNERNRRIILVIQRVF